MNPEPLSKSDDNSLRARLTAAVHAGRENEARISQIIEEGEDRGLGFTHWKILKRVWEGEELSRIKEAIGGKKPKPWALGISLVLASLKKNRTLLRGLAAWGTDKGLGSLACWTLSCSIAVKIKDPEPLALLLEVEPPELVREDKNSLEAACRLNDREKVEMLLEHGADPNSQGWDAKHLEKIPVLAFTVMQGDAWLPTASLLLEHGTRPTIPDVILRDILVSKSPSLELAEWIRSNEIRATSERFCLKNDEAISPATLAHALWAHLQRNTGKDAMKLVRETIEKWPTETIRGALEARLEPADTVNKMLKAEMLVRKRLVIGQTRPQKEGPALEF
jgi:hypothetical protein